MRKIFLILISLFGLFQTPAVWSADCSAGDVIVLTSPRAGLKTLHDAVTVRGFLCERHPYVLVRNETTNKSAFAQTDEDCRGNSCTYRFAVPMRGLAPGSNQIKATIPGEDPPIEVEVEVIRTALALLGK